MTYSSKPIACTLNNNEFKVRRKYARELLLPHLTQFSKTTAGVILMFNHSPSIQSHIEQFVELEQQCCGFLTFTVDPQQDMINLSIEGGADSVEQIQALFNTLTVQPLSMQVLSKGGLASTLMGGSALLLCCLPLILAGVGLTSLSTYVIAMKPQPWVEITGLASLVIGIAMVYIAARRKVGRGGSGCC